MLAYFFSVHLGRFIPAVTLDQVTGYASVIDRATGDPTYIQAQ